MDSTTSLGMNAHITIQTLYNAPFIFAKSQLRLRHNAALSNIVEIVSRNDITKISIKSSLIPEVRRRTGMPKTPMCSSESFSSLLLLQERIVMELLLDVPSVVVNVLAGPVRTDSLHRQPPRKSLRIYPV